MPYDCVVLVKQVPDTKAVTGKAMNDDGTVNRAALPAVFNPEDLNALELALQIKDRYGGSVTVITMGTFSPYCNLSVIMVPSRDSPPPRGVWGQPNRFSSYAQYRLAP